MAFRTENLKKEAKIRDMAGMFGAKSCSVSFGEAYGQPRGDPCKIFQNEVIFKGQTVWHCMSLGDQIHTVSRNVGDLPQTYVVVPDERRPLIHHNGSPKF
jgi:hypothetical protein